MTLVTVPVPLYHGTSSLFLESILGLGLGAKNPLVDLRVSEFVDELAPLVQEHLRGTEIYENRCSVWEMMVAQSSGHMNFQHGDTYLTPSIDTAVRYATSKRYGSELLSYAVDFLQLLVLKDLDEVQRGLYQRYPEIFALLEVSPAPLVFEVGGLVAADLKDERGGLPDGNLQFLGETAANSPDLASVLLQQVNFRLTRAVHRQDLRCWFVSITEVQFPTPKYSLYALSTGSAAAVA